MNREAETLAPTAGTEYKVRVPASTSNLGAGFDCFGLALGLYLSVSATVVPDQGEPVTIHTGGEGVDDIDNALATDNLIFRAMRLAAECEGLNLPPVSLAVHNEIPFGRGLGSSAAAIVAGIQLCSLISGTRLSRDNLLRYALKMEGHADNIAAAVYGGFVVTCVGPDGGVVAIKRPWPSDIKLVLVSPATAVMTSLARSVLPPTVERESAVYNLQRAALFSAALDTENFDLLWEAMQDRMHQTYRQSLVPGLAEALSTKKEPGLLGIALSGSGPSIVALVSNRFEEIGESIAWHFRSRGIDAKVRLLDVDDVGLRASIHESTTRREIECNE